MFKGVAASHVFSGRRNHKMSHPPEILNNPEMHPQPEKIAHPHPPIIVKGIKDFVNIRSELVGLVIFFKSTTYKYV